VTRICLEVGVLLPLVAATLGVGSGVLLPSVEATLGVGSGALPLEAVGVALVEAMQREALVLAQPLPAQGFVENLLSFHVERENEAIPEPRVHFNWVASLEEPTWQG